MLIGPLTDNGSMTRVRHLTLLLLLLPIILSGCATQPPKKIGDICEIFREKDDWFDKARKAETQWRVPIHLQMAFLRHESGYRDDARPPRRFLLGFIPWTRPSSAYGYAQALDGTWDWYLRDTGKNWADRDDFGDAADFVSWYVAKTRARFGIPESDVYRHYLAYHEGQGGYARGSHRAKPTVLAYARKVEGTARRYQAQLSGCSGQLAKRGGWWPFW